MKLTINVSKLATILLVIEIVAATGCTPRLVFATKTNLGLDVSGTAQVPDKVSFTYGRYEGAIVPRSETGDPYSVYGGLDADVKFWQGDLTISQEFATGAAAQIAAAEMSVDEAKTFLKDFSFGTAGNTKSLYFVTDSSLGIKISVGKQDVSPTLMVGYKRVEGAVIPVGPKEKEARSVYANIKINNAETRTAGAQDETHAKTIASAFPYNGGIRLVQGFATGRAADFRAMRPAVQQSLRAAAETGTAAVAVNLTVTDKVASWIASGASETDKKDRFRKALAGIYPTESDVDTQFSNITTKDEAAFKKWFRENFGTNDRAVNRIKENTKSEVSF